MLASPLEWSVNGGPVSEAKAPDGWNLPGVLDVVANHKYGLARLGTVQLEAGEGTLTFCVRRPTGDSGIAEMFSAQIDALGIAPVSWAVEPASPPARPEPPPSAVPIFGVFPNSRPVNPASGTMPASSRGLTDGVSSGGQNNVLATWRRRNPAA